jgi:hypothetical protein
MGQSDSLAINHNWVSTQTSSNFIPPSRSPHHTWQLLALEENAVKSTWLLKSNGSHRKFHNHIFTCFQMLSRTLVTFLKKSRTLVTLVLVDSRCSIEWKVQLDYRLVLDILEFSNSKNYNTIVVDCGVLYTTSEGRAPSITSCRNGRLKDTGL